MSKKILSRIAAAVLSTGLVTAGFVAGSSGPANAYEGRHYHFSPDTAPDDSGTDVVVDDGGGVTTQRLDTGWG